MRDLRQVGHRPGRGEPPESAEGRAGHARPPADTRPADCRPGRRAGAPSGAAGCWRAGSGAASTTPRKPRVRRARPRAGRAAPRCPPTPRSPPRAAGRTSGRYGRSRRWAACPGSRGTRPAACRTGPQRAGRGPARGAHRPPWPGWPPAPGGHAGARPPSGSASSEHGHGGRHRHDQHRDDGRAEDGWDLRLVTQAAQPGDEVDGAHIGAEARPLPPRSGIARWR